MRGTYHPHQNPVCEYTANSSTHSPLLGYAFDGFPIYGPYGYANTNGTGGIRRITSSYRTRNITQRRTLPDGTVLQASQYGPDASTANPLGKYGEDFEYVSGLGDLDEYNGRISVTPEYPNGIYAYFVTITDTGASAYPYLIGAQYYGVVAAENITQQGQVTITEPVTTYVPSSITADFDGDTRTDFSVFRPTDRTWYVNRSSDGGYSYSQFGFADDPLVPSDFDGDGKADIAVFRPSTGDWWIKKSNDGTIAVQNWGLAGDFPVPADYDGDGKADVAIFRPSTGNWWIRNSGDSSVVARQWGISEDKPVVGDYDGDGKADIAVFRPSSGNWYFVRSSDGSFNSLNWGLSTDKLVQADYDGDGKTDVAVFRPTEGLWYVLKSSNGGFTVTEWGVASDQPAPGDFDGDGKADLTIFRPSTGSWWVKRSASTNLVVQFGSSGDLAVSGASVR